MSELGSVTRESIFGKAESKFCLQKIEN